MISSRQRMKEHDLFRNPLKLGYTGMTEKE